MNYWNAKICKSGHIVDWGNKVNDAFCSKCGKETFSICTSCETPIRGAYKEVSMVVGDFVSYREAKIENMEFPFYCPNCGAPYEWTQLILSKATELLSYDENVDEAHKEVIKNSIPNLLIDTPETPIAIVQYQSNIEKFGTPIKDAMSQLLVDFLSETAKKAFFPGT